MKKNAGFTPFRNRRGKRRFLTGFTLIEILIATGILVLVGVGVIVVEKQFMGAGSTNKHKLQATALAQEGINLTKAKFTKNLLDTGVTDKMTIIDGAVPEAGATYFLNANNELVKCNVIGTDQCANALKITQNNVEFTRTITFPSSAPTP